MSRRLLRIVGIALAIVWLPSLRSGATELLHEQPYQARRSAAKADAMFEELSPSQTGLGFTQPIDTNHPLKCLYVGGYASPGIAIGDLNGDGLQDVFMTGGPVANRLFLNTTQAGNLRFQDITKSVAVDGANNWAAGVTFVDIDNDGDLDIYVCNYDAPNELFINETKSPNDVRFVESAKAYGLDLVDASFTASFCDYDSDGDLDVYVSGYQYVNPAGRPAKPPVVKKGERFVVLPEYQKYYGIVKGTDGRPTFTNVGRQGYLLASNGSAVGQGQIQFADVTKRSGLSGRGVSNSALWWDFNGDQLPDLYVANDFKVPDQLFRNNGDGTFTDVIRDSFPHTTWFSMGSEAGDINNDGLLDLFVSDMAGTTHYRSKVTMGEMSVHRDFMKSAEPRQYMRNALLLNTGTHRFLEAAYMAGLAKSDWSWAVKLADLDNDGRLDAFITNGAARMFNHSDRNFTAKQRIGKTQWELWEDAEPRKEANLAFRNLGDLAFENVSSSWGLNKNGMSYAAAYGDLDNDGDLDLIVANLDEPASVYRNNSITGRSVRVRLVGTNNNRSGLLATVQIKTGDKTQVRQLNTSMGFLSCNEPVVHFGIGNAAGVDELSVVWPNGARQVFQDLDGERLYVISEGDTPSVAKAKGHLVDMGKLLFTRSRSFPALRHVEKEYDDYQRQPLLPYSHSQLGPAISVGDIDNDGDFDFYHGRAKGSKRAIYENLGGAKLQAKSILPETEVEDMGVLFFDADSDGDRDLYCVSGGVECEPGDAILRDRLYLNDGRGGFQRDTNALPDVRDSGSVVCAADFDQDGDLDLFVGGRVVPGQYPVTPTSRILRNDSSVGKAKFADATNVVCADVLTTGLVTGAMWSDVDADGWPDLLVTHEWGPVKLFRNELADTSTTPQGNARAGRVLVDRTREAGLQSRIGWWNAIAGRDFDGDGDIDYVVTNQGLNTQYKASDEKPELLYYGSFDGGPPRLLEAKYEAGKCFPRRGLSCSSHAMPFVRDRMKTFHNFGISTLEDIYTEKKLASALRLAANELRTGVLINDSGPTGTLPKFRFQPLPRFAQISPSYGIAIDDFNADGYPDVFLAQNFFSPQLETGRMDSGLSAILLGREPKADGELQFHNAWPRESGILIPGDAKSCSLVDFNRDGWTDLLVGVNDGPLSAFEARPHRSNRKFRIKLIGKPGNLDCVGARVTVHLDNNAPEQTAELTAGAGYLSQSTTVLSFGCGRAEPQKVTVRWPDGKRTQHDVPAGQSALAIRW